MLHQRGRVAPETVERVERIIREVGYTPNVVARQLSLSKQFVFSVVIPSLQEDAGYWRYPQEGIDAAVRTMSLRNVTTSYYYYDRYSRESFREACDSALAAESDGIILAPTRSEEAHNFISEVSDKTPLVLFDAAVGDDSELSCIGQDAFQGGVTAGRLMSLLVPRARRFVIIEAGVEDKHLERRAEGFRSYFTSATGTAEAQHSPGAAKTVEAPRPAEAGEASGSALQAVAFSTLPLADIGELQDQLEAAFARHVPDGVFVTNAMAFAVAGIVNGEGRAHTPVIGYDLVEENTCCLRDGTIDFIIHQRPRMQGYQAAYALYRHVVLDEKVEKRVPIPIDVVMRENLEYYLQTGSDIVADRIENPNSGS